MAVLLEAINVKRKMLFEFEGAPYACMEADVSSPTARGGQTLVRLKMRNLLTNAVFEKSFKASDKFKEPDVVMVPASYLYTDGESFYFLDQDNFETLALRDETVGSATDYLLEGLIVQLQKYNGNPINLQLPVFVDLKVTETEPPSRDVGSSGGGTKLATLETGATVRLPLFIKEGETVKVSTETGEFAGRA